MTHDRTLIRTDPASWTPPLVVLLGTGMNRGDLGARALAWIDRAEALVGGKRLLLVFPDHPAERIAIESPIDALVERVLSISTERRTLVLASGDPLFFGIGKRLIDALGRERILTVPNVTSLQTLAARIAEPWGDVQVVSCHGRGPSEEWFCRVDAGCRVFVLTDHRHGPGWLASRLLATGRGDVTLVVGEDLGLPTERVRFLSPAEAEGLDYSALNVVLLKPAPAAGNASPAQPAPLPLFGIPEESFEHEAGLITKTEVRAVALAALELRPGFVLWDLGAGSGSVAIEASRIASPCRVVAVERNANRFEMLKRNAAALAGSRVEARLGNAAEILRDLPDPDRIFIGGGGRDLPAILEGVAVRLRPGGLVVQTAVMLDTLDLSVRFWREKGFDVSVVQVQVSRSVPIGGSLRFEALNPVFVLTARSLST